MDLQKRNDDGQEHINRRVTSEYIRIINFPNPGKSGMDTLVRRFLEEVVRYSSKEDRYPLTWPTSTGNNGGLSNFRVKMTYPFWQYFVTEGKKRLAEHNRATFNNIRVIRDKTINLSDLENLSLYLRKKIRERFSKEGLTAPDIVVKGGTVTVCSGQDGLKKHFRSTELAVRLGWEYSDWQGAAIKSMMTKQELRLLEEGKMLWGSIDTKAWKVATNSSDPQPQEEQDVSMPSASGRKRTSEQESDKPKKLLKKT